MVENILKVGLDSPKDEIKKVLTSAASAYDVTLGGGIESVSIVSSIGSASIDNDTLYLDFPAQDTEPFIINNQTVKGASITGADITFSSDTAVVSISSGVESVSMQGAGSASINNGVLNISIPAAANFTVNGSEVGAMSVTGAATVSMDSDTAVVSISSNDFLINGDTVKAMSLVGGVQEYDSDAQITNVTIPAGITNVSVQGAGNGSISADGKTLLITLRGSESKLDPEFNLTPTSITIPAYSGEAVITASYLADGIVTAIDTVNSKGFDVTKRDARSFVIAGSKLGTHDLGFWLSDTAEYYGASKNVSVTIAEPLTPAILMHFNDAENPLLNSGEGGGEIELITGAMPTISADYGTFGNGAYFQNPTYFAPTNQYLLFDPTQDFTFEFRYKGYLHSKNNQDLTSSFFISNQCTETNGTILINNANRGLANAGFYKNFYYGYYIAGIYARLGQGFGITPPCHLAYCYDSTKRELYIFNNGVKIGTQSGIGDIESFKPYFYFQDIMVDELRFYVGKCFWTENFTPPTEPY